MTKPREVASVLILRSDSVRTAAQARRVALQKGFVVRFGYTEGPQFFRFPQSDQAMTDFRTAKRNRNGIRLVKGEIQKG